VLVNRIRTDSEIGFQNWLFKRVALKGISGSSTEIFEISVFISDNDCDKQPS